MAADAPTYRPDFDRRSRSVAADLDEIFRNAAPAPAGVDVRPKVRILGATPSRAARTSAAGLGALIAVGLLGLAIGAALTRPPGPPQPPPPANGISTGQAPAIPVGPAREPPAAAAPATAAPAPAPSETAPAKPARIRQSAPKRQAEVTACQRLRGDARARCAYPAVMAADRKLRAAYAEASHAGVSRSTLARYRSRWASLRRQASKDPTRVIAGYRSMANELSGLTRRRRG